MAQAAGGRRSLIKHTEEVEELWFISMADLMSLLFCFFVLLTSLSAAPKNCGGLRNYFEERRAEYRNFELRNSQLECVITLPSDYLFQSGESALQNAALSRLRPLFAEIRKLPEHERDLLIVEGHTDDVPIRTRQYPSNWELSSARATNVANFMREQGLPSDRVSVRAFAENRPRLPYEDITGRRLTGQSLQEVRRGNRRVEIILVNPPTKLDEYGTLFH
jgi:flagellar motor protein MotB